MPSSLKLVPEGEVSPRHGVVIRWTEVRHVSRGNHVDAGAQVVLLVDFRCLERRLLESIVETQRDYVTFVLLRFVGKGTQTDQLPSLPCFCLFSPVGQGQEGHSSPH